MVWMPDIGELDRRVTIQQRNPATTSDAVGQELIDWVDVTTVWAQVLALRGREFFAAAQVQQEQTVKVRIRWRDGVTQLHRLVIDGQPYDITGVIPVGRKVMLEIMCLQGVKDGR